MKDFLGRNKAFLGIVLATILLLVGGVYLLSGKSTSNSGKVSDTVLTPKGVTKFSPSDTPLMLVEFGDYQCPACGVYHPVVKQILKDYSGKVNFVFRNFPLSQHKNAPISSYAVEAAGLQGRYWQMHDKIFENQSEWSASPDAKSIFVGYALGFGLDSAKFAADLDSQTVRDKVQKDVSDGNLVSIRSTPTFYLNGKKINLPNSYDGFKKVIEDALKGVDVSTISQPKAYHAHYDLKVYINGTPLDLSLAKYQSEEGKELDPDVHLHNANGKVVHLHKEGVPLSRLFDSIKVVFPKDTSTSVLGVYINGTLNAQGLSYVPQDLDRILVTYGPKNDSVLSRQLGTLSNDSCIYSEKCPERGTPPPEACVGGLGTGCEE